MAVAAHVVDGSVARPPAADRTATTQRGFWPSRVRLRVDVSIAATGLHHLSDLRGDHAGHAASRGHLLLRGRGAAQVPPHVRVRAAVRERREALLRGLRSDHTRTVPLA
eukprot:56443-Eustigmatos_ZCMA.PRE.1